MRHLIVLCLLALCVSAAHAQCPDIIRRGDTLFAPEAQTYQWLHDGNVIPNATQRFYLPPVDGDYTVRLHSLASEPLDYTPGPTLVVTGAVLDEFLRPISGADVTVAGVQGKTGADGRFFVGTLRATRLTARAQITGFHPHTVGFMPTGGDTQFVYLHLAKQLVTHKLPAVEGGTVSHDGFWLTLPPNGVATADGKLYAGEVQLSVVARRPGDGDFAQRMPGGDFMATDKTGAEKVLVSYGFTGVEMTTADGKPLNMAPGQKATIEFLITPEQRPDAPAELPLWHFDEAQGLWVEDGVMKKEGLTYKAQVGHFSWWNCDFPQEKAYLKLQVVNCWGQGEPGFVVTIEANVPYGVPGTTDTDGRVSGIVPANVPLLIHIGGFDTTVTLTPEQHLDLGTYNFGWGAFRGFGVADTNRILTVYTYGNIEEVEFSLDGETWQKEPVFVLPGDSVPPTGWARVEGCDTLAFPLYRTPIIENCHLYALEDLASQPGVYSINELLIAQEPICNLEDYLGKADVIPLLTAAAARQSCVQSVTFNFEWNMTFEEVDALFQVMAAYWPNLTKINAGGGDETMSFTAPPVIATFTRLEELQLWHFNLPQLPTWVADLPRLRHLSLTNGGMTSLPDGVGNLVNLDSLDLYSNDLTVIPESIGNLNMLRALDLRYNQLTTLPDSIANLTDSLEKLYLRGNPISPAEQARIRQMLPNTQIYF